MSDERETAVSKLLREDAAEWVSIVADAIQSYWLDGIHDEDMREWWSTQEASDAATEMAVEVVAQIQNRLGGPLGWAWQLIHDASEGNE